MVEFVSGGLFVSLVAPSPRQRQKLRWIDLLAVSFEEQETNVKTALVVFDPSTHFREHLIQAGEDRDPGPLHFRESGHFMPPPTATSESLSM